MARLLFEHAIKRISPPWLQRLIGGAFMESLGVLIDNVTDDSSDGVKLRFPNAANPEALSVIGRERRILRGPSETAAIYAIRLLRWWDDHRTRGGPYALLTQLREFFLQLVQVQFDVVYQSGTRFYIDDGGITRDSITWGGHGDPSAWAHVWVFFNLEAGEEIITLGGDELVTLGDGEILVTATPLEVYGVADVDELEALVTAIPREWNAAHVPYITVTLLYPARRLWNYPQPVPTWAEWGAIATWGGGGAQTFRTDGS